MTQTLTNHDYLITFHTEISRLLRFDTKHPMADDVAQTECVKLLEHIDLVRDSYPNPGIYARARVRHAGIDHDRRQAVQRGEGARLVTRPDGTVTRARVVLSGDIQNPETGRTILEEIPAEDISPDEYVERSDPRMPVVQAVLAELPQLDRRLVLEVKGGGETVTAVAARLGLERTAASKILNRALGRIYRAVEESTGDRPVT